ncbi:MAG: exosome complex protein Rrp42 [Candidatus Nitrosocaldus sp.]|nr:exosome complex protein Rrp42 [Candidatus Nitrosocaldus sp.]MDW8000878.1 exosome complex protein Rrp42 [Candidatus Nitrosocaldus sp.]
MSVKKTTTIVEQLRRAQMSELLAMNKRLDGRGLRDYRELRIETGLIKKANGSALVSLGNTQVIAGIKVEVDEPFPDMPDKGLFICNAEVLPLASPYAEPGPPDEDAIELARVVDRGIRESEMIALDRLVLISGKKVYAVFADVSVLNTDGNLFDATSYAVVAALLTARVPRYDVQDEKLVKSEETIPLPINTIPVSITMAKIGNSIIVDPNAEEEACMDARITMATDEQGRVCAMQKGGSGTFSVDQLNEVASLAISLGSEVRERIRSSVASSTGGGANSIRSMTS